MSFPLFLYNVLLALGLLLLFPVWLAMLLLRPRFRAGLPQKLGFLPDELLKRLEQAHSGKPRLWFHAVSVGEFNAIRSLAPLLADDYDVVLSTTTRTGHDLAVRTFPDRPVLYFPLDFRPVIERVMRRVQPDLLILAETELWPNVIDYTARCLKVPVLLINGRLSQQSMPGYARIRGLIKPCLRQLSHIYMQTQAHADRIRALGDLAPEQVTVAGNLKFDLRATVDPAARAVLMHLFNLGPQDTVMTCASTHHGEDEFFLDSYLRLKKDFPELKLILAPRHPERRKEIQNILSQRALNFSVRSQLSEENPNRHAIILLDTIGEMLTVYSLSTVAIMGGAFVPRGGQNPLEPISQRVPVIFGPHMDNFQEIVRLILEVTAGYQVHNRLELVTAVTTLLTQPEIYDAVAENGQQLIENNRGAKDIVVKAIRQLLPPASATGAVISKSFLPQTAPAEASETV